MTVNEMETLTGLERASILFYERKKLITPPHLDNGSRDYSEEDLKMLLKIRLLRSLHVPLSEITALKSGRTDLTKALSRQSSRLELEQGVDVKLEQEVCRAILYNKVSFTDLDAEKYLSGLTIAPDSQNVYDREEVYPQVFRPWRRYFARMLDLFIYSIAWWIFVAYTFNLNLLNRGALVRYFDSCVAIILMLFIEPLWLHFLGTTPGKAIFGLRIENRDGNYLSYSEGLSRTWCVIGKGLGYNIPIYNLVRLWKCYNLCSEFETQWWDYGFFYTVRDIKWFRAALYIVARVALLAVFIIAVLAQRLPPNRGDLTVAEFAENFNYYCKYYNVDFDHSYLDSNGDWAARNPAENYGIKEIEFQGKLPFQYNLKNGKVTGISLNARIENNSRHLYPYNKQMILASFAFTGAQKNVGIFSDFAPRIEKQINNNTFKDFSFFDSGVMFKCIVDYSGYEPYRSLWLMPSKNVSENYLNFHFFIG